jgi:FHA domain
MSACPQCGTVAKPSDKFCNVCGTPVTRASAVPAGPPGPPAYGAPAPPPFAAPGPGGFGGPPAAFGAPQGAGPARCQMGHEIAPGASYCAQGHPIALDQMQFGNDAYGANQGGYAPPPQQGYGAPPPQAQPYGAPPPAPAFGAPPPQGGFAQPPQGGFGAPPAAPGFGPQPGFPPAAQPGGFGGPPQPAPGFGPSPAQGYGPNNDTSRDAVPPKIVRGFLVAYGGTNPAGDFWPLTGGRLQVGRLGAADGIEISLQDPTISSRHAAMVVDAQSGGVSVEDTGSTNGTFVNDEHIGFNGRRELRDGDRLRFGGFTTIVKVIGRI